MAGGSATNMAAPPNPRQGGEPDAGAPADARDAAARTEAARRSFLRMMSHELRTPLNSIIGFAEILSCELYGPIGAPQYQQYAEIIRVSGQRLLRLVNQALEIIRLEGDAGELDLHPEPLDAICDDAAQLAAEEAEARGVTIAFDPPRPPPVAVADQRGLRTAVLNLLQNAIAFSPEGGVVRMTVRTEDPWAVIEVADDGEGLDPAEVPRLMGPFEQGENALIRRTEGAGLGWPVVRLLAKAMGGHFHVDTAPGQGLTATIRLRRAE